MHHAISALRYRLVPGPACLEPLQILAAQPVHRSGWEVAFFVLGASHAVRVRHGSRDVTELLACLPLHEPGTVLLDLPADRSRTASVKVEGMACRVRLTRCDLAGAADLNGRFPDACRLGHAFPVWENGMAPTTLIGWHVDEGRLLVETIHTYPEAGHAVRSRSLFMVDDARPHRGRTWNHRGRDPEGEEQP